MSQPEIEWSLEDAPPADEPLPPPPGPAGPRRPRGALNPADAPRWLVTALLILAAVAAGAWVFTQVGWRRLRDQITAEVVYEDEHARAGDVDLVLALQSETDNLAADWRQHRRDEVAAGLAAPLPAGHLVPDQAPPAVATVEALSNDLFVATVVRGYHDSAGRAAAFALPQRYRNRGPGLWERLPPDLAALQTTTVLAGERLSATLPVEDLPWLSDSLLAADQLLVLACAEWGDACAPHWKLFIRFSTTLSGPRSARPPGPGAAAGLGPYPAAFDLIDLTPRFSQPLVLLSPHLTGLPHDDGARQALTHALAVYGLGYLANAITGTSTESHAATFFRDALVARAELRLGLAPAPTFVVRGEHYLPAEALWTSFGVPDELAATAAARRAANLPVRLLALNFLDSALAGRPPADDAVLLDLLTRPSGGLYPWLNLVLGFGGGERAAAEWQAAVVASFDGQGPLDWARLEGLAYTCEAEGYLIRAGAPQRLPQQMAAFDFYLPTQAVSPDGRYLAYMAPGTDGAMTIYLYDLVQPGVNATLTEASEAMLVGWSGGGALVTIEREASSTSADELANYRAWRYDPANGERARLSDDALLPSFFGSRFTWTPDRATVLLNGYYGRGDVQDLEQLSPVLMRIDPPGPAQRVPRAGYGGLLSADGRRLAYTVPVSSADNVVLAPVEVYDLATQTARIVLAIDDLLGPNDRGQVNLLLPAAWTPDARWLLVMAAGADFESRVVAVPAGGEGEPVVVVTGGDGFMPPVVSGDGRYLAYVAGGQTPATFTLRLFDLSRLPGGDLELPSPATGVASTAFSPDSQLVAMAGLSGVRVLDLASGQMRWVSFESCGGVGWHDLGP